MRRAARWGDLRLLVVYQQMSPDDLRAAVVFPRPLLPHGKPYDMLAFGATVRQRSDR